MAYPGVYMLDDGAILRALQRARANGSLISVHAENGPVIEELRRQALAAGRTAPLDHALTRPPATEGEAIGRVLMLAELADAPVYVVHLCAAEALGPRAGGARARRARLRRDLPAVPVPRRGRLPRARLRRGQVRDEPAAAPAGHQDELWRGLADGDLQVVGTDHCPFCMGDERRPRRRRRAASATSPASPTACPAWRRACCCCTTAACAPAACRSSASSRSAAPRPPASSGSIRARAWWPPASDADLVIFDPLRRQSLAAGALHMRVDYSPYEGRDGDRRAPRRAGARRGGRRRREVRRAPGPRALSAARRPGGVTRGPSAPRPGFRTTP